MPTVPVDTRNTVQLNPLPRERLQAADFGGAGEQIGNAVARFGQQASQAVEVQDQINEKYDTAAAKDQLSQALTDVAPIRNTVLSAKGKDAVEAKTKAVAALDDLRKKYIGSMANPRQQQMLGDAFDRIRLQETETYDTHERKQVEQYEINASEARYTTSLNRAVDLAGTNDEAAHASLADALTEVAAANKGADAATIALKKAETVSDFHASVVQKLADGAGDENGDALAAKEYLDKHAGEITPATESKARRALQGDIDEARLEASLGKVYAGAHGIEATPTPEEAHAQGGEVAKANGDPLRGRGGRVSSGFTDTRDGGRRMHAAEDLPAAAGTPVYPPMSGKVEKVWFDKEGGNSVLIRHGDGRVTGYAHLRNINVEAGQEVDASTTIGGVGNTGSGSHGNHLHFTVRDASGARVDPAKQTWREKGMPPVEAGHPNVAALYERARRVALQDNLSPKQTRQLLAQIDQDAARQDRLRDRAQEDARDAAYTVLDKLGENFTSPSQIPLNIRQGLKPGMMSTLQNIADSNKKGDAVAPYSDTFLDIYALASDPTKRDDFVNADLYKLTGRMTKSELGQFRKMQIDMKAGKGQDKLDDFDDARKLVDYYKPQSPGLNQTGVPAKQQQMARIREAQTVEAVRNAIGKFRAAHGGSITDDQKRAIARGQLATVYEGGDLKKPIPRAIAGGGVATSVPADARRRIIEEWRKARGNAPLTEGMIARTYLDLGGGIN